MSVSRLQHYCSGAVSHHYLDHRTGKHKRQTLSQEEMIGRYISHVLARHFKMVRYSGFLTNRKRGTLLPLVYEALLQAREKPEKPGFAVLIKGFLGTDRMHSLQRSAALCRRSG
ncbi:transposase family protein [Candidatus Erwinia dacicola]|uniref:Transposase family protein n=1 Tax=Candidatus Erwinia dacicola TaxID=252393 RepID=A0A328TMM0_9GAMM|nr:transposase [Candidatus Erwinia dacicola]RAP70703.1 transposase family protein [Candidatus Erwinia dacicola]